MPSIFSETQRILKPISISATCCVNISERECDSEKHSGGGRDGTVTQHRQ